MKNDKKIKATERELIFDDIQKTPDPEPEPYVKFTGTIQMGKRDEMIEKIISEEKKD